MSTQKMRGLGRFRVVEADMRLSWRTPVLVAGCLLLVATAATTATATATATTVLPLLLLCSILHFSAPLPLDQHQLPHSHCSFSLHPFLFAISAPRVWGKDDPRAVAEPV